MHDPTKFSKIIKDYLVNELKYRHSKYTDSDIERFTMNIQDLKFYKVPISRQSNGYDCGIYVVKYVRYVLDIWPSSSVLVRIGTLGLICINSLPDPLPPSPDFP